MHEIVSTLGHALWYANKNWRLIPDHAFINGKCTCWKKNDCPSAGKHPRIEDWTNQATTDSSQITRWFQDFWPNSNIGLATGSESDVFVVDIDQKNNGVVEWEKWLRKYNYVPNTPVSQTGSGGLHVFYKWPETTIIPTKARLVTNIGIDLRGEGGQAVLPPSGNENGFYQWVEGMAPWEIEVAEAPAWLLALISSASVTDQKEAEKFNFVQALAGASEGDRNQMMVKLAGSLRAQNFSKETAISWAIQAADNCDPPYPHKEAIAKVDWAYRKFEAGTSWKEVRPPYAPPVEVAIEWQKPVGFDEAHLPSFPTESLPGWVKCFSEAVAETTQTPQDMAAMCGLAVLATACARKMKVHVTADWSEPVNLYTATCARPGSRKSAVFRHMTEPIRDYETRLKFKQAAESNHNLAELETMEEDYTRIKKEASKAEEVRRAELFKQMEALAGQIEIKKRKCVVPDLMADDITPQAIKTLLHEQGGRLAILSAEGDIFGMMNGRYQSNGEPDIDVYLKGHPGDDIKVNRLSRASEDIRNPALTIGICTQKKSLRGLLAKTGLSTRGLYARFLYAVAENDMGEENMNPMTIPLGIKDTYHKNVMRLLSVPYRVDACGDETEQPHVITLSTEARAVLDEFRVFVNLQRKPTGLLGSSDELGEWGAKLAGAVVRIAGLLHIAENVIEERPWEWEIDARTMAAARDIGSYFITHAIAAHAQMEATNALDLSQLILAFLCRTKKAQLTKQDAVRCTKKHGQVVENALLCLVDRGYIRDASPGRQKGLIYDVNPQWDYTIAEKDTGVNDGE